MSQDGPSRSSARRSSSSTCRTSSATARSRCARGAAARAPRRRSARTSRPRLPAAPGVHRKPAARGASGISRVHGGHADAGRQDESAEDALGRALRRADAAGRVLRAPRRARPVRARQARRGARRAAGEIPLYDGERVVGAFAPAHEPDESLRATVLLENLACKASGVHALRFLLERTGTDPESIEYVIGCGEEAVGDRYQRGGGASAKAIAEAAGLVRASGSDVKAFCAAPVHALIVAGALVESGVYERVVVVAGRLAGEARDEVRGRARSRRADPRGRPRGHGRPGRPADGRCAGRAAGRGRAPRIGVRLLAAGAAHGHRRPRRSSGSGARSPTSTATRPSSTTPRSRSRPAAATSRAELPDARRARRDARRARRRTRSLASRATHGLPGFSPTQGHIASAVPWLPHALAGSGRRDPLDDVDGEGQPVPRPHDAALGRRLDHPGGIDGRGSDTRRPSSPRRGGPRPRRLLGPRCQPCMALMPAVEALEETYEGRLRLRQGERSRKPAGLP